MTIKSHTLRVGYFNILLSPMDKSTSRNFNREIRELTDAMSQIYLADIYRSLHPNTQEYTFFSAPHGTSSKTEHILGNEAKLHRYKK